MRRYTGAAQMPTHRAFVHTKGQAETQHRLARSVANYDQLNLVVCELSIRLPKALDLAVGVRSRSR